MTLYDPKSPAPAPTRIDEILMRTKKAFAAKGFDGASMQDLARAAGMSAGNFYRYFPSKDAIVESLVLKDIDGIEAAFDAVLLSPDPRRALLATLADRLDVMTGEHRAGALWAEIEAVAIRRDSVGCIVAQMEGAVKRNLLRVFARIADITPAEAERRYLAHAVLVLTLVKGAAVHACQRRHTEGRDEAAELIALVLDTVDRLLSDIASAGDRA